jgi:hypothetical protein
MLKYLGIMINQNYIHDEFESRLNLGHASYHVCIREATTYTARVKQRKHRTNYSEPRIQRKSKYVAQKVKATLTRGARIL